MTELKPLMGKADKTAHLTKTQFSGNQAQCGIC